MPQTKVRSERQNQSEEVQHPPHLTRRPPAAPLRHLLLCGGVGFSKEDLHKPIIGIASTWTEIGPCNFHLRDVAEAVKREHP